MKAIKSFMTLAFAAGFSIAVNAQTKTETFKVAGNCGMCKSKIEKSAKEAGAKDATWNAEKQEITVTYKASTTNAAKIQQKIADAGYDNAGFKSTTESYNRLPGCCKYERAASSEAKTACCTGESKCAHDNHAAKMDCCKDGKCTKEGHSGADCCKHDAKADCCKDGKCTREGHNGNDCCKKEGHH